MPIYGEKYPRHILIINNVGVYGIFWYFFLICFIITAIARPKNMKSNAKAYFDTNPYIIFNIYKFHNNNNIF